MTWKELVAEIMGSIEGYEKEEATIEIHDRSEVHKRYIIGVTKDGKHLITGEALNENFI